jgi:hypothetical protein
MSRSRPFRVRRIRPGRHLSACASVLLAAGLAACGSSSATGSAAAARAAATTAAPAESASVTAPSPASTTTTTTAPSTCASTVAGTLGQVTERIYHVAATGGDVAEAVHRVQSSTLLAGAIAAGNARAADTHLNGLLLDQIAGVEIIRGGRVFASAGSGAAIAPVRGSIPGTGASFVLSVQSDHDFVQVAHQVTGAQIQVSDPAGRWLAGTIYTPPPAVVPNSGPLSYGGLDYQVASLAGTAYPSGAVRIALLVPSREIACPGAIAQARVETLGHAGERIYQEERSSPDVTATLRKLERALFFRRAVAERSVPATRAAIEDFFAAHIHVVRVRVSVGGRLLVDVGGPYALAPVQGTLRLNGRVVGQFEMAIQDDAGYLKLAHLFTGAEVLMREGSRQVMGTLSPGPASVPGRGAVTYRGRSYEAYSFAAEAFPSGALRISLLIAG